MPSATFSGAHEGYYFGMGAKGLGYYRDEPVAGEITLPVLKFSHLLISSQGHQSSLCAHYPPRFHTMAFFKNL